MRKLTPSILAVAGIALASLVSAADNPHIVVILTDDLGYGDLGSYNPESKISTPHLDQLAAEGLRFTDAHAPGALCHVSRYGLLTGRYPFRHKFDWRKAPVILEGRMTIASLLKGAGYRTAMVGKWHLGFAEDPAFTGQLSGGPVDRGFESYFGIRASTDIPPYFYIRGDRAVLPPTEQIDANDSTAEGWSPIQGAFWREGGISPDLKLEEVLPRFTSEAVDIIKGHMDGETSLFLYLAYPAPHTPWLPSDEFVGTSEAGSYGDFTTMVDAEIGKVLAALEASNMAENTLVIFTSDNGPVWYDADIDRFGHDSAGGLRGMKADAWEAGHRMPFLMRWPAAIEAGRVTDQTICFTDLFATLAEMTSQTVPANQAPDSESILAVIKGSQDEADPIRSAVVMAANRNHFYIRDGDWKLITGPESGGFSKLDRAEVEKLPSRQLYNLREDPGEQVNLIDDHPEKAAELLKKLESIRDAEAITTNL